MGRPSNAANVERPLDYKTVGCFLKISKEIGKDLLFDWLRVLEYAKIRTVFQSKRPSVFKEAERFSKKE